MKTIKTKLNYEIIYFIKNEVIKYKRHLDTRGCKNKIDYKTFINIFIDKLETNLTWERLGSIYKISKSHIHNTYCKWVNYGIFKNAFTNFLNKYHLFINKDEAYIDTTTIFNKYGYINTVGMNTYESKKHKTNKLSILASKNGIPLGIHIDGGNIHDIKLLINTLHNKKDLKFLYADRGYISKKLKEHLLTSKNINLITPYKRTQHKHNTDEEIQGLKNRMKIEHLNNKIKQNKSLNTRYIKDLLCFEGLIYLGCLKIGLQIIINDFYKF